MRLLLFVCFLVCTSFSCVPQAEHSSSPNILLILVDDMGYGDPGSYNPDSRVPTPHIDRLAREGLRFTDAHSNSAVCTPTRYGLLTGRYAWRTSLKQGVLWGYSPALIDSTMMTLPRLLQQAGYVTAGFGKWHLGLGTTEPVDYTGSLRPGPLEIGFDTYFGIPASLDMQPYVYFRDHEVLELPTDSTAGSAHRRQEGGGFWRAGPQSPGFEHIEVLPRTTNEALAFFEDHVQSKEERPFFVYVPYSGPHTPWLPHDAYRGTSGAGYYGDFATEVDAHVGRLLNGLDALSLDEETLVIFTSDNGAHWLEEDIETFDHRANGPWRGQKADIWEGGHRVPFIARWPGVISANTVTHQTTTHTDVMATLAGLLDIPLAADVAVDSYNMWPAYLDPGLSTPIRTTTIHHSLRGMFAIRQGAWKYIEGLGSGGFTAPAFIEPGADSIKGQLYHLIDDPSEQNNLYTIHPDTVRALQNTLDEMRQAPR